LTALAATIVLFLAGLGAGVIMQRSRFCFVSGIRDLTLFGATGMARAVLVALFAASLLGPLAITWRLSVGLPVPELVGPPIQATVLGGLVFGFGMVIAGSCGAGTFWRLGEGQLSQLWIVLGMLGGSWLFRFVPMWQVERPYPAMAVPVGAAVLAAAGGTLVWWDRRHAAQGEELPGERRVPRWRAVWRPEVGALGVAALLTVTLAITGTIWRVTRALRLQDLNSTSFVIGLMLGGFAGARLGREWRLRRLGKVRFGVQRLVGGLLMGYSAQLAWGCTIGALLGGMAIGSTHAWYWMGGAIIGGLVGSLVLRRLLAL